jgi:mRNA interferase MazF
MTITTTVLKRGDVVLVLYPNSDLKTAKQRPALIVQIDNLESDLNQVVVAMITSRTFRANHPSRVLILLNSQDGKNSGLLTDSVVMTDNIATILVMAIDKVIGKISMAEVDKALKHTLGL